MGPINEMNLSNVHRHMKRVFGLGIKLVLRIQRSDYLLCGVSIRQRFSFLAKQ